VIFGEDKIKNLFSKEQRELYRSRAPEGLKLNNLSILGPITLLKLVFVPEGLARKFVAEMWLYPDGSRILELSTKCTPANAFQVAAEAKSFLLQRGIDLTAQQQPKTTKALKYFSSLLQKSPAVEAAPPGDGSPVTVQG
jgi:hypothetical protein